jgi:complex III assembly factor LYRM7
MPTLLAARHEARKNFEANRGLSTESDTLSKQITHAEEVARFLRENVVQGQADDDGKYSTLERASTALQFRSLMLYTLELRIHEHTERGDNEDIKKGKGNTLAGTKCCSS